MKKTLFALLLLLATPLWASGYDHSRWNELLASHVQPFNDGVATAVDYAGFAQDGKALQSYLDGLSAVSKSTFDAWPESEQLAFLINAYNAWTVKLILGAWPDLKSIKDLGSFFRSPWSKEFIPLLGETRSLDDIEHGLIRGSGRYRDPRIHFAVNCASIGCPALRPEAFRGVDLDRQLAEQTRSFLSDRTRNRKAGDELELSSIFKWYREDFEKGWKDYTRLEDFLLNYAEPLGLTEADQKRLRAGKMKIDFLPYDWRLNAVR